MHYSLPLVAALASLGTPVLAKDTASSFAVTLDGKAYDGKASCKNKLINVRGRNVNFDINCNTLGVYDYTLTGAADPERMVTSPTVIFSSKVPELSPAQLSSVSLKKLTLAGGSLEIIFGAGEGKVKVQAKDDAQGGIFQLETEFAANVTFTHTLGPGVFYFKNAYTGKINFGDGKDAVTSGPTAHEMLLGKDSPQVATKLFQNATVSRWQVAPGGRLGGVLGEDAIELSQGATACTSDCQAQNRVQGSLTVPPNPSNPTPLRIRGRSV